MNEPITRREALKKGALFGGAALVWVRPSVNSYGISTVAAEAVSARQGCTPGFWKTHPNIWQDVAGVDPTTTVGSVFNVPSTYGLGGDLLLDALGYNGGGGETGGARILLRAGAAAYLNAMASAVDYGATSGEVKGLVDAALNSGDRDEMIDQAGLLDAANNAGCPINAHGEAEGGSESESNTQDVRPSQQLLDESEGGEK